MRRFCVPCVLGLWIVHVVIAKFTRSILGPGCFLTRPAKNRTRPLAPPPQHTRRPHGRAPVRSVSTTRVTPDNEPTKHFQQNPTTQTRHYACGRSKQVPPCSRSQCMQVSRGDTASTASGAINSHGDTWRTSLRCSDLLNIGEVHVYFRARSRACFRARGHTLQDLEFLYLNRRYASFRARGGARLKA